MRRRLGLGQHRRGAWLAALLALACCIGSATQANESHAASVLPAATDDARLSRNQALFGIALLDADEQAELQRQLHALAPQRPGLVDMYVLGFGGDASERVFRNEIHFLDALMRQRLHAGGRIVTLVNDGSGDAYAKPWPWASRANLRSSLQRLGHVMDRNEDVLFVYMTMHGSSDHRLHVQLPDGTAETLSPQELGDALDEAGIRHRVIVLSACYAGGFAERLRRTYLNILRGRDAGVAGEGQGRGRRQDWPSWSGR